MALTSYGAMDVKRQRLIDSYPAYMCMQKWDTLQAMLVYGVLDLQAYPSRRKGDWKQSSYCKDLKDPFLVQISRALSARIGETPHEDPLSASTHAEIGQLQRPRGALSSLLTSSTSLAAMIHKTESPHPTMSR